MEAIMKIVRRHELYVIEDNAQAIGADTKYTDGSVHQAGTIGHIGCTSFFPSKNLGCFGDGGAMITNDDAMAAQLTMIANHGQSKRYYHDVVGVNSRLDSIQAAVLDIKLRHLDQYNDARRSVADTYDTAFTAIQELKVPHRVPYSSHVFHQYTLRVLDGRRDALHDHLQSMGVPCMIYYPVPLYAQEAFKSSAGSIDYLPVTDMLCKQVISLPIHTEMTSGIQQRIIDAVQSFFAQA
jgi:UDP-2-acetamido-2-deoxy-ribo-hexuluronate aminotransferase